MHGVQWVPDGCIITLNTKHTDVLVSQACPACYTGQGRYRLCWLMLRLAGTIKFMTMHFMFTSIWKTRDMHYH